MGRRGPAPDYAKRERLAQLLADGVSLSEAARQVGVNRVHGHRNLLVGGQLISSLAVT